MTDTSRSDEIRKKLKQAEGNSWGFQNAAGGWWHPADDITWLLADNDAKADLIEKMTVHLRTLAEDNRRLEADNDRLMGVSDQLFTSAERDRLLADNDRLRRENWDWSGNYWKLRAVAAQLAEALDDELAHEVAHSPRTSAALDAYRQTQEEQT